MIFVNFKAVCNPGCIPTGYFLQPEFLKLPLISLGFLYLSERFNLGGFLNGGAYIPGPGSSKDVEFNPGLSQILRKIFLSKNMQLERTKYCRAYSPRYRNDNAKCYSKQCIGR